MAGPCISADGRADTLPTVEPGPLLECQHLKTTAVNQAHPSIPVQGPHMVVAPYSSRGTKELLS